MAPWQAGTLEIGDLAPSLQVESWIKGKPIAHYEPGKVYLIEFWAVWCGPCLAGMPHLSALQKKYGDKLRVIGVTSLDQYGNSLEAVRVLVEKKGDLIGYSIAWDVPAEDKYMGVFQGKTNHAIMRAAHLTSLPVAVVVDGAGRLAMIGNPSQMEADLDKVVNGKWNLAEAKRHRGEVVLAGKHVATIERLLKEGDRAAALSMAQAIVKTAAWDDAHLMLLLSNQYAGDTFTATVKELALALKCANRAVELTQRIDPGYLDNLAALYFKKGDLDAAIRIEKEAVGKAEGALKQAQEERLKKYLAAKNGGKS